MQKGIREADIVPLGVGYYTIPEAARLLGTPPRNIARWLDGYSYRDADGNAVKAAPLWRTQLPRLGDALEIGFRDLIELRFVLAFLRQNVSLNVIRRCLENARAIVGEERPFSTQSFRTDGRSIFLESLREATRAAPGQDGSALVDLKTNLLVFKQVVERTFKDLDIEEGSVVHWRPYAVKPSIDIDPTGPTPSGWSSFSSWLRSCCSTNDAIFAALVRFQFFQSDPALIGLTVTGHG